MTSLSDLDERSTTILSAEVGWAAPAPSSKSLLHRGVPHAIGAVGRSPICVVIAAAGWLIAPERWVLGLVGLPVTTFLAWRMRSRSRRRRPAGSGGARFGPPIATIVMADALVVTVLMGAAACSGSPGTGMERPPTDPVTAITEVVGFGRDRVLRASSGPDRSGSPS